MGEGYGWENGLREPGQDELENMSESTFRTVLMMWLRVLRSGVASAHRKLDKLGGDVGDLNGEVSVHLNCPLIAKRELILGHVEEAAAEQRTKRKSRGNWAFWTGVVLFLLALLDRLLMFVKVAP